MLKCWHVEPKRRPPFSEIYSILERLVVENDNPLGVLVPTPTFAFSPPPSPSAVTSSTSAAPTLGTLPSSTAYGSSLPLPSPRLHSSSSTKSTPTEEDESGEGSGSVDLNGWWNQGTTVAAAGTVNLACGSSSVPTANELLAYGASGVNVDEEERETRKILQRGKSESGEDQLEEGASSLEKSSCSSKRKKEKKDKKKKSKKDKKHKKDKKKDKLKGKRSIMSEVKDANSGNHGSTIEQVRLETTRSSEYPVTKEPPVGQTLYLLHPIHGSLTTELGRKWSSSSRKQ